MGLTGGGGECFNNTVPILLRVVCLVSQLSLADVGVDHGGMGRGMCAQKYQCDMPPPPPPPPHPSVSG